MSQADTLILEFLYEKEIGATPGVIAYNIDYHRRHISRRCKTLESAGLLENVEGTIYEITELGTEYVEGTATSAELEGLIDDEG